MNEMNEFKGMNWHEWVETNVKRMKWNEWVEMHDLSTSSWKSGTHPSVFDEFYVINYLMTMSSTDEMELSLQSRAHFVDLIVDLIFKKCKKAVSFFLTIFMWNRATVSCACCRPLSRIKARTRGNRDPVAATTDGHFNVGSWLVLGPPKQFLVPE